MKQPTWCNLPNAQLIDQVLADLRANPEVFAEAWYAAYNNPLPVAAWDKAYNEAWDAVVAPTLLYNSPLSTPPRRCRSPAGQFADLAGMVQQLPWLWRMRRAQPGRDYAARNAACGVIRALVVYADSPKYLDMSYEKLQSWAILSERSAAVLLLPYVYVREQISSKVCA